MLISKFHKLLLGRSTFKKKVFCFFLTSFKLILCHSPVQKVVCLFTNNNFKMMFLIIEIIIYSSSSVFSLDNIFIFIKLYYITFFFLKFIFLDI